MRKAALALAVSLAFLFSFIHIGPVVAPTGGNVESATSLSFDVAGTAMGYSFSYTFKAKDLGSSNAKLRIDMTTAGTTVGYILNGALQKVWVSYGGTWTEVPGEFSTYWSTYDAMLSGYLTELSGWTGGDFTYNDPSSGMSVTISNIQVNPTLADSLFQQNTSEQNDMGTGGDAGNSMSAATLISAGSGTGYLDSTDTTDYYKVAVSSGQTVRVSMTPPSGSDFDLYIYDTNQSQVDSSNLGGSQTDTVEATASASGYFYIYVYHYSGSGTYSMTVTITGGGATQNDMGSSADAGNSIGAATTIPAGSGTGYIDSTDANDYYKVNITSGQTISVSMTPPAGSDFDLKLYDANQSQVDSSSLGGSQTDTVEDTASASGYFYIHVYRYSGSGIYSMTVTVSGGATQNDMGTGTDAGNTLSAATTIVAGSGTGYIDSTDPNDYYKINVTSGQTISVSMTPPSGSDFDLKLYDANQSQVDSSSLGGSQTDSVTCAATSSGYYYTCVHLWSGSGIYSMTVTVTGGATQNDMNTGTDAGNSLSAAITIAAGSGTGYIDSTDIADYYKVSVSSGQTVSVSMTPPSGSDFDIKLYDTNQSQVDSSTLGGSQTDSVEGTASASGYFYIYVYRYSGSGIYSMIVTVTGGATQNDMNTGTDAGNTLSAATAIATNTSGTGYIDSTDTTDYYKISVTSGQTVSVSMTPPSGSDFDLKLYDANQSQVASSSLGGSQTDSVTYTATSSGYLYICVYQWSGSGIYSMTVTVTGGTAQNDANSGQDAGNSFVQALTIGAGSYTGFIDSTDTDDYYKVNLSSGQTIWVSLIPPYGSDFDLYLYDPNQTSVASSTLGSSQTDTVSYVATSSGYHYIRIKQWSGSGVYSFTVWLSSVATQNDWSSGQDAGDSRDQALAISPGSGSGYLDSTDTNDYYKITTTSSGGIDVILTPPTGSDFDLYLYDSNGSQVASSTLGGSQTDTINYTATSTGDWYIRVHLYSGEGTYSLQVSASSPNVLAESLHPYPNNYDQTWTISEAGAGKIRVHFTQLDVESDWDYVYIYDGSNNLIVTYTGSHRDMWTDWVTGDTIRVRLVSDYSITGYGFTIDMKGTGTASPTPTGNKFAILVGVNDYIDPAINDLPGCVEDAADWKTYLTSKGYQISYFLADGQATEANIKQAIASVVARAGADSTIVFAFSGHGAKSQEVGLPAGNSVICTADSGWGTSGNLTDIELHDAFTNYQGRLMVFLDSCRSGGMNEVVTDHANRYMTTACSDDGYGFGIPQYQNGAWGYWFADKGLVREGSGHQDMEGNFAWAKPLMINDVLAGTQYNTLSNYPQQFDGDQNPANLFTL